MAEPSQVAVVNVGEVLNRRLSGFQVGAIAICAVAGIFDGFDIQSIGILAPAIAQNLHIPISAFGTIFSLGWLGVMIGTLLSGPIADRYGRRIPVIVSVFVFGVFTLLLSTSHTYNELVIYRFLTGLGLGGVLPNVAALTSEYAPQRSRGRAMLMMFSGIPCGSVTSALLASVLVPIWGWRAFLYIGALLPILLGLVLLKALPESLMFLVTKGSNPRRVAKLLNRIAPDLACNENTRFETSEKPQRGAPVRLLFAEGRTTNTLLIWVIFFTNFAVFMLPYSWLASILRMSGLPLSRALVLTSMFALGGIVGMWITGYFTDKFGVRGPLIACYIGSFVFMVLFGVVAGTKSMLLLGVMIFILGAFINASQGGANVLVASLFPTSVRSTAIGFAFTVGRLGSILSPAVGGMMLAAHWGFPKMFFIGGLPAVIGAIAIVAIRIARAQQPQAKVAHG
jgi:AAHS family 4-hydroxybenzoate transporter-like MFS transporter